MDFSLSDEGRELRELARKILETEVTNERLRRIEAEGQAMDAELWQALARAHLLGVAVPEAYGGSGFGFFELCLLLQEVGRTVAPLPAVATLALGALPLAAFGSEEQKRSWLPAVTEGRALLSAALIELDAPDPLDPGTTAKREGDGFLLEGCKSLVPAGGQSARVLVPARCEDGRIGVFLVDPAGPGVACAPQGCSDRQPYVELRLARARASELLGDLERGAEILHWLVRRATAALCAVQLGVSERALEMTAAYTRERHQFDRPVGSFQAVHQRAGDAFVQVEAMRLSLWEAAWRLAEGLPADHAVAIAKYWAAEGGHFVAYAAQHLHGGIGVDVDYPLHRYFLWTTQLEHTLGAARAQLSQLGDRLAERSAPEACG
jgi:alkylation response protein AidB-like acyl-CoA dehydrogenase